MKRTTPVRPQGGGRLSRLSLFSLLLVAAACAPTTDPASAIPSDQADDVETSVEALVSSAEAIEADVGAFPSDEVALRWSKLRELVADLDATRSQLQLNPSDEVLEHLGRRADQITPQARRLQRVIDSTVADPGLRDRWRLGLSRLRIAARSVSLSVGEVHASRVQPTIEELESRAGAEYRNGPAWPGSPFYLLDEGHIDAIDAAYEDGAIGISIHDESIDPDVERDPATTMLIAKSESRLEVPDDPRFAFLGTAGAPIWLLPEAQQDAEALGILWPGISTEEMEPGLFLNDDVRIRFKAVVGPNGLSLFLSPQDDETPPTILVDSEDGLPDVIRQPAGVHQHMNWAFESAGIYLVRVDVRARLAGVPGNPWVTSATATLKFVVLP